MKIYRIPGCTLISVKAHKLVKATKKRPSKATCEVAIGRKMCKGCEGNNG